MAGEGGGQKDSRGKTSEHAELPSANGYFAIEVVSCAQQNRR
ncbi:hypothetical protein [Streptomyces sp. KMM 9044]|nr:hypothetical protein [Streptomyces sp. KMM 9044]WAX80212.1 hypothetical protein HUV60_023695 [Streptomyces sp. KMM 9044]